MALNTKKNNLAKLLYQFAVLAALGYMGLRLWFDKVYTPDFEAYCPFGGLQAFGSYITRGSLSCSMTSMQIMMGVMLFIGAVFFSKLFCGYICPIGTISEWIDKLSDKLKLRLTLSEIPDNSLRSLKYMLLFITFYFTLTSSELFCKKYDPYYAVASGYNSDVVILYALIATGVFTKEGLKNIKCFGSSTSFANQIRKVDGIFGVSTYVGSHTVKILYNKTIYNDTTIQKLLFVPGKRVLADINPDVDSVAVYSLAVDRFFDPLDASCLQYLLQQKSDACGYQSDFACPVIIRIYFPNGKQPDIISLIDIIESESLTYKVEEATLKVKLNYKVVTISEKPDVISKPDFNKAMFPD